MAERKNGTTAKWHKGRMTERHRTIKNVISISQIQYLTIFHIVLKMTKSTLVAGKAAVTSSKRSPGKGKDASKGPNPYSPSPKRPPMKRKFPTTLNLW